MKQCQSFDIGRIEDLENVPSLQQRASRVEVLEKEVQEFRSRLKPGSSLPPNASDVDNEEYNRVLDLLASFDRDYGKLVVARNILEAKCRYYEDLTKDWRAYVRRWELKHGRKLKAGDSPEVVLRSTRGTAGENYEVPCEPAPPSFHEHVLSPSRSLSATIRHTSPPREVETGLRTPTQRFSPSPSSSNTDKRAAPVSEARLQNTRLSPVSNGNTDCAATSDGSEPQVEAEHFVNDKKDPALQGTKPPMWLAKDDSDFPTIISERSLKRKRAPPTIDNHTRTQQKDNKALGSISKPVHVKSEQGSSSPAVPQFGIGSGGANDSLDLDDVGNRLLTPRKIRRLELQRRKSSTLKASTATETGEILLGYELEDADSEEDNGDLSYNLKGKGEPESEQYSLYDKEYYMRKGEEYGMMLWEEGQRKSAELQKQAELDAKVPEWLRGSKNRIRAQQFLQNERTGNRRARLEANQKAMPARIDTKVGVPQLSKFRIPTTLPEPPSDEGDCKLLSNVTSERPQEPEPSHGPNDKRAELPKPVILRPKDPNYQILPRTSEHLANQKRRLPPSRRDHGTAAIPFVAEDGENLDASKDARNTSRAPQVSIAKRADISDTIEKTPKAPDVHHRLGDLLAKPSPENPSLSSEELGRRLAKPPKESKTPPVRSLRSHDVGTPTNQRANAARNVKVNSTGSKPTNSTRNKLSATKLPPSQALRIDSPPITLPSHEPLRARPLRRLRAEDFKPNPTFNQGRDFAFSEVVRSRDQRQCLPGCDKPHCCGGQLRKMVQIGGYTPSRKSLLGAAPSQEAVDEDQRILLDYLGSDASARLKRMSEDEKQELLLQAKTKLFADEYGRHRQAYGRAPTPPGFWRTDMPSTQEEEEDRRQAWCLERVRVEEMYREARREGGKWRFKDE